ncbi:NAD-dependent epimerase/dehydratase family protein [Brumimicrobium aurantiacum]|uniref:NAD-dependent epimerase/dehydratase family protein n=1 Tax=Brumimicrobium aurantiacum TaxID=1737063 RepID=A0A3E1F1P4_9FLAO|nr:NAD-dependent epimerase/dehydratase family protein [Brumimicrobium aurantiacum]RFC55730.1 NAD-dependent epimerase/dehydratase family protein [Brumimicrobium aurantiacum]
MINILVTGGAGFIPSCLTDKLAENPNYNIVAVDNFLTGHPLKITKSQYDNYQFIEGDCNNYEQMKAIFDATKFDYVFHYAAVVGVKRTTDHPLSVLEDIEGLNHIFKLSAETKVKRIFFSSSSEVYGEPVELPQRELTTPLNSKLPYAIVKNLGEAYCRSYFQAYNLEYTIFRFFNTYGPKQSPDFVMSKFIKQALSHKDITIYGDGSQTRTFCHVDDNIDACITAFEENKFINDVVNVGNDKETTILDLAKSVIKQTESKSKIVFLPPLKEGDMTRRQPCAENVRSLLNREFLSLDEGMKRVIASPLYRELNNL